MALLSTAGVALVALMMVGSAAAASTNTTLVPRYKGLASPQNTVASSGCQSSAKEVKKSSFSLKTGLGTFADTGKAGNCGSKVPKGFSFYNSAETDVGFMALVKLPKLSANTANVSANLGGKYSWTAAVSTGGKTAACPSKLENIFYNYTTWEWNSFSNYAYTDFESENGVIIENYSYNIASIPSPFNLNNTTYYYHDEGNYTISTLECFSEVFGDSDVYADLCDTTTGICYGDSGSNAPGFGDFSVELENYTDFSTTGYTDTEFDEGHWYNYSTAAYNDNRSGAYWDQYSCSPVCTVTSGSTPGATSYSTSNSSSFTGTSIWWTSLYGAAFNHTHQYYVELNLYVLMEASNSNWVHGSATYSLNGDTGGNGVKLVSITIS